MVFLFKGIKKCQIGCLVLKLEVEMFIIQKRVFPPHLIIIYDCKYFEIPVCHFYECNISKRVL